MNESPVNPQPPSEHRSPSAAPAPSLAYEPPRDRIVTEPPPHVDTKVFAFILGFILAAGAIFVVNVRYVVSVFTFFGPP
ncbi:MAG TPA: hypothetical protein VFC46_09015, partial [Humisphaera sp.]|nr:hypothetical protein [Humisphaera sp.]